MPKLRMILWCAVVWVTPAVVGGMLGWPGIWGGGSAFGDLILPAPITGGIIHVPSFIAAIVLVLSYKVLPDAAASIVRAGLFGVAVIGLAQLVDLDRVVLSFTTDLQLRRIPWQQSYLGLCLFTDSLWTIAWTIHRPRLTSHAVAAIAVAVLLPLVYLLAVIEPSERVDESFVLGVSVSGPQRGDESQFMYTTLNVRDENFQEAASAAASQLLTLPESNGVVEDMAIYFTDSLEAAMLYELERVLLTLCVYEDGTPDAWLDGQGDCFSDHETFSERYSIAFDNQPRGLPLDVKAYLAARTVCVDVELPVERDNRLLAEYRCYGLDEESAYLQRNYSDSGIREVLLANP